MNLHSRETNLLRKLRPENLIPDLHGSVRMITMRLVLTVFATLVLVLVTNVRSSSAQTPFNYPWCLNAGGKESNFESCAFDTFDQCMQTGWGDGGFCYRNPGYKPPLLRSRQQPRRTR